MPRTQIKTNKNSATSPPTIPMKKVSQYTKQTKNTEPDIIFATSQAKTLYFPLTNPSSPEAFGNMTFYYSMTSGK